RREYQNRIRRVSGRKLRKLAKYQRENNHRQKRADQAPGDANDGLLIANGDVSPGQKVEQLSIGPEITPVVLEAATRLDEDFVHEMREVRGQKSSHICFSNRGKSNGARQSG